MSVLQSRNVIAVISDGGCRFRNVRLTIPRRGSVYGHVKERLSETDLDNYVGTLDSTQTTWID